jgi:four helix bundle protein
MAVYSFKDLTVWQKSFALAKEVYLLSSKLPKEEQFGLVSQMRRCAISIPSNIAEGHQRNNTREYKQFLGIAKGSAAELETQLLLSQEIHSLDIEKELALLTEIQKMLNSLIAKLIPKT